LVARIVFREAKYKESFPHRWFLLRFEREKMIDPGHIHQVISRPHTVGNNLRDNQSFNAEKQLPRLENINKNQHR
jgi:hypothetical protein